MSGLQPITRSSQLSVEVVWLSAADGVLRYRSEAHPLDGGVHPDDAAWHVSGLTLCTPGALLHSTSWRYARGSVVLTYVALPDPDPHDTVAVPTDAVTSGGGPLHPSPAVIPIEAVAAHACRHLALLAVTDPQVAAVAAAESPLWTLITKLPCAPAGTLHPAQTTATAPHTAC
ncbi:MAG: hypothetical protein HOV79_26705 [Hamadaea sp.]|nr:hypothetical protein [Hamadaea sp.]